MMVVHQDSESPVEVPVIKKPLVNQKSYIIVNNHVKELSNTSQNTDNIDEKSLVTSEAMNKKRKTVKKHKKSVEVPITTSDSDNMNLNTSEVDSSDIEELKTVYMKCKEVMKKIESKYGHLLNLKSEAGPSLQNLKRKMYSETIEDECNCTTRKKIVFDDEGRQSTVDVTEKHICVKKMKNVYSETPKRSTNIAVEYQDAELGLPDNLQELAKILHDPDIEDTYRNKVLEKMKLLKQEYLNELKFNRHILIEQLKSNPDELLNFKGTNLATIPGYS